MPEITLKVYDVDGSTLLATLDTARQHRWLDELNGPGTLGFVFSPAIEPDGPDTVKPGRFVRVEVDSVARFAGIVRGQRKIREDSDRAETQVTCVGIRDLTRTAVVYPEGGLGGALRNADVRQFGWQAAEYDDAAWASAVSHGTYVSQPFPDLRPEGWPDDASEHIWDRTGNAPQGNVYFRKTFSVASETSVEIVSTCDDEHDLYLDGQLLLQGRGRANFRAFQSIVVTLPAGAHVLAARGYNYSGGGTNPAWLIAAVLEVDADNTRTGAVLARTDTSWDILAYPATPPGQTPGKILAVIIAEATARGALAGMTTDVSATTQSDGSAWPDKFELAVDVGSAVADVIDQMVDLGVDVHVTPTGVVRAWVGRGVDRTGTVTLAYAVNAQSTQHVRDGDPVTAMLLRSDEGWSDLTTGGGSRYEQYLSLGGSATIDAAEALASIALADLATDQIVTSIKVAGETFEPYVALDLGDTILATSWGNTSATQRIQAMAIEVSETSLLDVTYELVDVSASRRVYSERERQAAKNSATALGTAGGRSRLATPPRPANSSTVRGAAASGGGGGSGGSGGASSVQSMHVGTVTSGDFNTSLSVNLDDGDTVTADNYSGRICPAGVRVSVAEVSSGAYYVVGRLVERSAPVSIGQLDNAPADGYPWYSPPVVTNTYTGPFVVDGQNQLGYGIGATFVQSQTSPDTIAGWAPDTEAEVLLKPSGSTGDIYPLGVIGSSLYAFIEDDGFYRYDGSTWTLHDDGTAASINLSQPPYRGVVAHDDVAAVFLSTGGYAVLVKASGAYVVGSFTVAGTLYPPELFFTGATVRGGRWGVTAYTNNPASASDDGGYLIHGVTSQTTTAGSVVTQVDDRFATYLGGGAAAALASGKICVMLVDTSTTPDTYNLSVVTPGGSVTRFTDIMPAHTTSDQTWFSGSGNYMHGMVANDADDVYVWGSAKVEEIDNYPGFEGKYTPVLWRISNADTAPSVSVSHYDLSWLNNEEDVEASGGGSVDSTGQGWLPVAVEADYGQSSLNADNFVVVANAATGAPEGTPVAYDPEAGFGARYQERGIRWTLGDPAEGAGVFLAPPSLGLGDAILYSLGSGPTSMDMANATSTTYAIPAGATQGRGTLGEDGNWYAVSVTGGTYWVGKFDSVTAQFDWVDTGAAGTTAIGPLHANADGVVFWIDRGTNPDALWRYDYAGGGAARVIGTNGSYDTAAVALGGKAGYIHRSDSTGRTAYLSLNDDDAADDSSERSYTFAGGSRNDSIGENVSWYPGSDIFYIFLSSPNGGFDSWDLGSFNMRTESLSFREDFFGVPWVSDIGILEGYGATICVGANGNLFVTAQITHAVVAGETYTSSSRVPIMYEYDPESGGLQQRWVGTRYQTPSVFYGYKGPVIGNADYALAVYGNSGTMYAHVIKVTP